MDRASRRSRRRSFLLLTAFLIVLVTGMARPRPARAEDLGLIIGITAGVLAVVIVAGTWLVYSRKYEPPQRLLPGDPLLPPEGRRGVDGVAFAPHCQPADGQQVPLLCW